MDKKNIIIMVLVAVVVAAGGFFAGMQYQKSQRSDVMFGRFEGQARLAQGQGQNRGQQSGRMMVGMRPVMGEIISSDDTSITVKMEDGSSKIVLVSDKTSINKSSEASLSDLKTGEKVAAFGTENSDGSVTAQNIQLNPQLRMMQVKTTDTQKESK